MCLKQKSNKKRCTNYRDITQLSQIEKIFERIFTIKIRELLRELGEDQNGFRSNDLNPFKYYIGSKYYIGFFISKSKLFRRISNISKSRAHYGDEI